MNPTVTLQPVVFADFARAKNAIDFAMFSEKILTFNIVCLPVPDFDTRFLQPIPHDKSLVVDDATLLRSFTTWVVAMHTQKKR